MEAREMEGKWHGKGPHHQHGYRRSRCNDGTICENAAPCAPHPIKEGSYVCDCLSSTDGTYDYTDDNMVLYVGVYCEHEVTTYCERGRDVSAFTFCANEGECEAIVGQNEAHSGCKCPFGYTGEHCQFVDGAMPSDWTLESFMHPALLGLQGSQEGMSTGAMMAVVGAIVMGSALLIIVIGVYLASGATLSISIPTIRMGDKEMDTGAVGDVPPPNGERSPLAGRRPSAVTGVDGETGATAPRNPFVAGKSVYKKKASTGQFVTEDTLEADGEVLMKALEEQGGALEEGTAMEDVSLEDKPGSLQEKGEFA